MGDGNVAARVRQILIDVLDCEPGRAADDEALLTTDLGADSLDMVEIAIDIENHLKIKIDESEWGPLTRVGDLVRQVEAAHG